MTRIKQLLLLGGLFEIIFSILAIFTSPLAGDISTIVFLVFVVMAIIFLFKRKVEWAHRFAQKHGNITAYLYAIGWAPYLLTPYALIASTIDYKARIAAESGMPYIPSNPELLRTYIVWNNLILYWGLIFGLLLATVYVLRNLYLSLVQKPKAKPAVATAKAKVAVATPKKEVAHTQTQPKAKKSSGKKGKIKRAPTLPAKSVTKKAPVKKAQIKRAAPAAVKPVAKSTPAKKGQNKRAQPVEVKRDLKAEPEKKEIRKAQPLKLKK